jgi:hypothetical protein
MYPRLGLAGRMFQLRYFGQVGRRLNCHRLLYPHPRLPWSSGNLFSMSSSILRESHPHRIESSRSYSASMSRAGFSCTSSANFVGFSVFCESDFSAPMVCRFWLDNHVRRKSWPAPRSRSSLSDWNDDVEYDSTVLEAVRSRYPSFRTACGLVFYRELDIVEAT